MVFSTNVSQLSSSLPRCSIWALTKGLSPSQKNWMSSDSSGAPSASNLIMEMLEVRRPIVNFHLLVLGVLSNATPGGIHGSPWVTQTLSKKSFELNPKQKILDCLVPKLVLMPTKVDHIAKEQSCKRGAVGAKGTGSINMILALLEGLLGGLRVLNNWP